MTIVYELLNMRDHCKIMGSIREVYETWLTRGQTQSMRSNMALNLKVLDWLSIGSIAVLTSKPYGTVSNNYIQINIIYSTTCDTQSSIMVTFVTSGHTGHKWSSKSQVIKQVTICHISHNCHSLSQLVTIVTFVTICHHCYICHNCRIW